VLAVRDANGNLRPMPTMRADRASGWNRPIRSRSARRKSTAKKPTSKTPVKRVATKS